ncbi:MAG: hypothetical protein Ct9H300mP21_02570 [Pseudomonadota bacterium]|nr:MAG: hypothetical protein Ct9H300mP21_02570 [Pseudomonadota bacterium]
MQYVNPWDLGPDEFGQKPLWGCYSLQLSPQIVQQEVEKEAMFI